MSDFESVDGPSVHEVARLGDVRRILDLCSHMSPADIDARNNDGLTALHVAARSGHVEAVRAFLLLGADPAARDFNNDTALHTAAEMGRTEVVKVLIEEGGADVTAAGDSGNTPLHCAAKAGHTGTVELLVSKQPSGVDAVNVDGLTPVEFAAEGRFADSVRSLAIMWSHRCARALHIAASKGDLAIIHCLMHVEGSDVNVTDEVGDTPLHVAAYFGQGEAAQALTGLHADVAAVNLDDETPLHLAFSVPHFIVVAALLRHLHVDGGSDVTHPQVVRSAWSTYGKSRNADGRSYLHWAVVNGAVGTLKALVAATLDLGIEAAVDAKGMNPLHVTARSGHVEAVRALLSIGCNVNARDLNNDTALHIAASMGHTEVVRVLIEEGGADVTTQGIGGNTVLHCAAEERRVGTVTFLLTWHPLRDALGKDGLTPVELATELGFDDVVCVLAVEWSDACARALHIAAFEGNATTIRSLMRVEGSDVNSQDEDGDTALHVAADQGHIEAIRALTELGADIASVNIDNETPLHVALRCACFGALSALLHHIRLQGDGSQHQYWPIVRSAWNALSNTTDANGHTYLHFAAMNGDAVGLRVLITTRVEIDIDAPVNGLSLLHIAAEHSADDPELVRVLLEMGADCNALGGPSEQTPLHIAARHGKCSVVQALIDGGCDVSAVDRDGSTALHHAAVNRQMEVVELLLVSMVPADMSVRNKEGLTPLCIAARGGNSKYTNCFWNAIDVRESFVNQMLDAVALAASERRTDEAEAICAIAQFGAQRGRFPSSPATFASVPNKRLHFAAAFGHSVAVDALISRCKDDVNAADHDNDFTPLHWAARAGRSEMVSQLMQHGARSNPVDKYGKTPLHLAASNGHTEAVAALLVRENRVKVNAIDNQGLTPLHWAAGGLRSDLASILIREGRASIDVLDMHGREPLHHAACSLCDTMISMFILEGGANVNTLDRDDRTPLHYAAASGNVMAISILIEEHGADVHAEDTHGRTPLHDAARAGYAHAVLFLARRYGANINVMDREGNMPLLCALNKLTKCERDFERDDFRAWREVLELCRS